MFKPKIKTCQNCNSKFTIEPEDFEFYEKIGVPAPTFCPECRMQRRLVLRNERVLYHRTCNLCKKNIISMYSEDKPYPVYCPECFFGDKWDRFALGQDIDFNRSFFKQYQELQNKVPRLALYNMESVNSKFINYAAHNKDCYLCFRILNGENCHYCYYVLNGQNCIDSLYIRKGELLYDCFECSDCYNSRSLVESKGCFDSAYSYDLKHCSKCLFCWNLRNKKYHIENKPVSPQEFEKVWQEYVSGSRIKTENAQKRFQKVYKEKATHRHNKIINCKNVKGINITNSKDIFNIYNCSDSENIRYGSDVEKVKDAMDVIGPMNSEILYEICSVDFNCYRIFFSSFIDKGCRNIWYSSYLNNSKDCFGCISLKNARNCILNKQYSEKEYKQIKDKLIAHMKEIGEFGENIPINLSPFAYNETIAMEWFPFNKEKAEKKGYLWQNNMPGVYGKETLKQKNIPDDIKNVKNNITEAIIVCADCGRNYKVTKQELAFYKKHLIPIPKYCPDCRYMQKLNSYRLPNQLIKHKCTCGQTNHKHHQNKTCPNKFESPYSKTEGPKNIWCEDCYKYLL